MKGNNTAPCLSCIHKDVCKFKVTTTKFFDRVNEEAFNLQETAISSVDVRCINYYREEPLSRNVLSE